MRPMSTHPLLHSEPIRRQKLYEIVVERIEERIRSGHLKPGDRLPSERDIMTGYQIGRPAVREALLALQNKGLVTVENGRRARVRQPSVENVFTTLDGVVGLMINQHQSLKNLFDARIFLEAAMARHAAKAMGEAGLAELKSALEANKKAVGDRDAFMRTDIAFHRALFKTAENPVFDGVHAALCGWLMERWRKIRRTNATERLAYQGHLKVYEAVKKRDGDRAEKAMRQHLEASWEIWERQL